MKRLKGAFLAVSAITTIGVLTGVPVTPAQACVIANFKNAANACAPGTTFGSGKAGEVVAEPASAPTEDVAIEPASAPAEPSGCVKTNVKNFKNACSN